MSTANTAVTPNPDENVFPVKQLTVFSPYQVIGIETIVKPVEGTSKDGRTYSFDSKNHIISIVPAKNKTLVIKVNIFDQEYQTLRAIATLYGGFEKCLITTVIDPSSTSRALKLIHTGQTKA
jgi:hypothetical protein